METATATKSQNDTLKFSLEKQLICLSQEQFLTLFSLYGQAGLEEYKQCMDSQDYKDFNEAKEDLSVYLAERIEADDNQEQKAQLLEVIAEYHRNYYLKDSELDNLLEQCKEARSKKSDIVSDFNRKVKRYVKGDNALLLKQYKEEKKLEKARAKRQRRIQKGLEGHLVAVACSVIDGGKKGGEEYIEKAAKEANEVLEATVALVEEMEKDKAQANPKTDKGTTTILQTLYKTRAARDAINAPIVTRSNSPVESTK